MEKSGRIRWLWVNGDEAKVSFWVGEEDYGKICEIGESVGKKPEEILKVGMKMMAFGLRLKTGEISPEEYLKKRQELIVNYIIRIEELELLTQIAVRCFEGREAEEIGPREIQ